MDALRKALDLVNSGEDVVIATVVAVMGSAPPRVGFRMVVTARETAGTVGGGALENEVVRLARDLLARGGEGRLERLKMADLEMHCGGEVTLFFDPHRAATRLWIFGGGHIARALVPMATAAGFAVTVVDDRPEYADERRFPGAAAVVCAPYAEAAREVPSNAYAVIVTHGHEHDAEVLESVARIRPPLPYIGMIGSARKVRKTLERLAAAGVEAGSNVFSPVGLDIGGDTPAEIALSIAAEIVGVRHGRTGLPHCRDRKK